jgi:GTP-binding protein LepA
MKIRNFSIVAHIDHGKSTLADRLLEKTGTISAREMKEQLLDGMDLERERGITIKAKAVKMVYGTKDGKKYELNLIDTPGHVDFSYEVARSLRACEGVLLLVDAAQGVEAQTVAHAHLAQKLGLKIIPVLNKIDLSQSDADSCEEQVWEILKRPISAERVSAKTGRGVGHLLERIVKDFPAPKGKISNPLSALIFDSYYDSFRGVVIFIRVMEGKISAGTGIKLFSSDFDAIVEEVGFLTPKLNKSNALAAGQVGYILTGIKDIHKIKIGDTIIENPSPIKKPLPGYVDAKPVVFASLFPINSSEYPLLKKALEKLHLTDWSFSYQSESSKALGFGFRLGFMGLLHLDIVKERLEREFGLSLIATSPTVVYKAKLKTKHPSYEALKKEGDSYIIDNPAKFPHYGDILQICEPYVKITIVCPVNYMENVINLLKEKRGVYDKLEHIHNRVIIEYELPLAEMVIDFYDKLKSVSKGYASFDYEMADYKPSDIVVMEVLLHNEPVDALSVITPRLKSQHQGRLLCEKLKKLIPRQQFEIAIQARVRGKIIARQTIPPLKKDVTAKCYGGDITRKRKLLERQKEGKKKMKFVGSVEVPQEAFIAMLKLEE